MRRQSLGEQELGVLRYVTENGPVSVRQVADAFAESHQLARTTLLTVLERLRAKGYVEREKLDAAFVYRSTQDQKRITSNLISEFVRSKLGGSVQSFVAYLSDAEGLTKDEIEELKRVVDKLDERQSNG